MEKVCCVCGTDVAQAKRFKDTTGNYYCGPCQQKKLTEKKQSAVTVPPPVSQIAPNIPPLPKAPPRPDDGLLALADEPVVHKEVSKLGCADCRQIFPENQIRNDDGEFVCLSCFQKRKGTAPKPVKKNIPPKKSDVLGEDEHPSTPPTVLSTILTLVITLVGSWLLLSLFFLVGKYFGDCGITIALLAGIPTTIFAIVKAALLVVSMLITARIFGGIEFGYLQSVIWKSMAVVVVDLAMLLLAPAMGEGLTIIIQNFSGGIFLLGFMALFRLDFMEAIVLSVINWGISFVSAIVFALLMVSLFAGIGGKAGKMKHDNDFKDPPPMVLPANPE